MTRYQKWLEERKEALRVSESHNVRRIMERFTECSRELSEVGQPYFGAWISDYDNEVCLSADVSCFDESTESVEARVIGPLSREFGLVWDRKGTGSVPKIEWKSRNKLFDPPCGFSLTITAYDAPDCKFEVREQTEKVYMATCHD